MYRDVMFLRATQFFNKSNYSPTHSWAGFAAVSNRVFHNWRFLTSLTFLILILSISWFVSSMRTWSQTQRFVASMCISPILPINLCLKIFIWKYNHRFKIEHWMMIPYRLIEKDEMHLSKNKENLKSWSDYCDDGFAFIGNIHKNSNI